MTVAICTPKLIIRASSESQSNLRRKFDKKVDRIKGFQKKLSEDRKQNISQIAKEIDDLVKSEISKSKSLIEDHIEFFKQEWEADQEYECDIVNPLTNCVDDEIVDDEEEDIFE